jgi:diaminopimelate epimerase
MGEPILKTADIPVRWPNDRLINETVDFHPEKLALTCVSMGNPHAVIFVDDVANLDIERLGKKIENDPMFPQRTNVEFVEIVSPGRARMRVWERGSGETLACGTGACATIVAGVLNGRLNRRTTVSLLGGDLQLEWKEENNRVYMTGEAIQVFEGEIEL